MENEILRTEESGRGLRLGDFFLWGWGWGARNCVLRGVTGQDNLQVITVMDNAYGDQPKGEKIVSRSTCIIAKRDTVFKLEDHWLPDFLHPEVVRIMHNERAKVLAGEYDKKKKKN